MILLSFWQIYYEFTSSFAINYGFSHNPYEFTIFLANLLWIHCLPREFSKKSIDFLNSLWFQFVFRIHTNLLSIEWILYELNLYFVNFLWISHLFLEFTMNLLYFSRIHSEFTLFFANSSYYTNSVYCGSSKNSFSASRIHQTPHSLSIAVSVRIHLRLREFVSYFEKILWIKYLFYNEFTREFTMYLLSISRIHYELTIYFANS